MGGVIGDRFVGPSNCGYQLSNLRNIRIGRLRGMMLVGDSIFSTLRIDFLIDLGFGMGIAWGCPSKFGPKYCLVSGLEFIPVWLA